MNSSDVKIKLNEMADSFTGEHGELLCLRANVAAINKMLINRNKGEELLNAFTVIIKDFKEKGSL